MSSVELRIAVDGWDVSNTGEDGVAIGGSLRGRMTVRAVKAVEAKGFEVVLRWVTDGPGNKDAAVISRQAYPPERMEEGRELSLPFEFRIPDEGPITYAGKYVKVNWELMGTADVPWAIDPKTSLPVPVVARME